MKLKITVSCLLLLMFSIISCKNNSNEPSKLEQTKDIIKTGNSVQKTAKQTQSLKNIDPVTLEEFKAWLPNNLLGLARDEVNKSSLSGFGISGVNTAYNGKDNTKLIVTITDGAGKNGRMLTSQYATVKHLKLKNTDEKSEKLLDSKTMTGTETYYKNENRTKLGFLYKDRFSVELTGVNMDQQAVWDAFKKLNVDTLF